MANPSIPFRFLRLSMFHLAEQFSQPAPQFPAASRPPKLHHNVHRGQAGPTQPKRLAHHALHGVAVMGLGHGSPADHQPQAWAGQAIRQGEDAQRSSPDSMARRAQNLLEFPSAGQAAALRKAPCLRLQLSGQPLAPLGAARFDDPAAGASGCASAEAMPPFPLEIAGLVGSFHAQGPTLDSGRRILGSGFAGVNALISFSACGRSAGRFRHGSPPAAGLSSRPPRPGPSGQWPPSPLPLPGAARPPC